ncbi:MAG: multidrug efflux MFS transporter [Planctomycetes bacterium]|nr:multidrug efflux MFS transporter [Planctomycetota bacterium]
MSQQAGDGRSHLAHFAPSNPWIIAIVATLATFMEVLDTSIANVSLPHIAGNLGASVTDSTWVLTSYLVANAVVLPATAFLTAVLGRRRYYLISVAVFTVSSLLCGIAPNLESLVLFRLLQGLGGGGLQPLTQAVLVDTFPPRLRGMGMAVYGMTVVVAPVIGPTLGGWITDNYSWRWIFLINVPIGIGALLLNSRFLLDPPFLRRRLGADRWRGDFIGLGLLALGLGCLQLGLDLGEREDWFSSPWITAAAVTAVAALIAGVVWSLRRKDPMVDLRVLRDRNLALACLHMFVFGGVLYGTTALLPLMLQTEFGYTAMQSGMALSPGGLVVAVLMPFVGFLVTRVDPRWMILFGVATISGSLLQMGSFSPDVDFHTVVLARMLQGLGLAFIFVPINTIAYGTVAAADRNAASSVVNIARNMGGSIGIGLISTFIARGTQTHRAMLSTHIDPFDPATRHAATAIRNGLLPQVGDPQQAALMAHAVLDKQLQHQAGLLAYLDQFKLLAVAFLVLIPIVLLMRSRRAGHVELTVE